MNRRMVKKALQAYRAAAGTLSDGNSVESNRVLRLFHQNQGWGRKSIGIQVRIRTTVVSQKQDDMRLAAPMTRAILFIVIKTETLLSACTHFGLIESQDRFRGR
ncbi:hypothetical protein PS1_003205 [Malus domestica]